MNRYRITALILFALACQACGQRAVTRKPIAPSREKTTSAIGNAVVHIDVKSKSGNIVIDAVGNSDGDRSDKKPVNNSNGKSHSIDIDLGLVSKVNAAAGKVNVIAGKFFNSDTEIAAKVDRYSISAASAMCVPDRVRPGNGEGVSRPSCSPIVADRPSGIALAMRSKAMAAIGQPKTAMVEPPFFPNPPPAPAHLIDVTSHFDVSRDFRHVEQEIKRKILARGYDRLHYFSIPSGFVMITDLERYSKEAQVSAEQRWLIHKKSTAKDFISYVTSLVYGEQGQFRLFAFYISPQEPVTAHYLASAEDVSRWNSTGALALSRQTGKVAVQPGETRIWLLIYEFKSANGRDQNIVVSTNDRVPLFIHLKSLGIPSS